MDYENLIERLRGYCQEWEAYRREQYRHDLEDAAEEISKIPRLQAENAKLRAELEAVRAERDAAIKTIFSWTGCPECKHWNSGDKWCEKHDREADACGGCDSPEWRGPEKGE